MSSEGEDVGGDTPWPIEGRISIVVPTLNSGSTIARCLQSIIEQTHHDKEIIVVDGGSVDGTRIIVSSFGTDVSAFIPGPDTGVYNAFNKGIMASSGEWILFLGSDDTLFCNNVLSVVSEALRRARGKFCLVYGNIAVIKRPKEDYSICGSDWNTHRKRAMRTWTYWHQGIFHHRTLFSDRGLFDESFRICGDQELILRELRKSEGMYCKDLIVSAFSLGGLSGSLKNLGVIIRERKRAFEKNGYHPFLVVNPLVYAKYWLFLIASATGRFVKNRGVLSLRSRRALTIKEHVDKG